MLNIKLLQKRNLNIDLENDVDVVDLLGKLTHVRLDRESITTIDNLESLKSVTNLYLQHNFVQVIENLTCLSSSIRFLTLAGNHISIVQGLKCLTVLGFLDLSDNLIENFDVEELPKSLSFVLFKNNNCTSLSDYRSRLLQNLPNLKSIDNDLLDIDDTSDDSSDSSDDDDQSIDKKLGFVEQTENGGTITEVCTDLLVRTSSRLDDVLKEHQERIKDVKKHKKPETVFSVEHHPYEDADTELLEIEKKMQNLLDEFVEAERNVLNKFEIPSSNHASYRPVSARVTSSRTEYEDGDNHKRNISDMNSLHKTVVSDDSPRSSQSKSTFVSVGTSSGRTATPPTKERLIAPTSKTRSTSKHKSKVKGITKPGAGDDSINRVSKNTSSDAKAVRSVSSSSLVRIPGARPFLKS